MTDEAEPLAAAAQAAPDSQKHLAGLQKAVGAALGGSRGIATAEAQGSVQAVADNPMVVRLAELTAQAESTDLNRRKKAVKEGEAQLIASVKAMHAMTDYVIDQAKQQGVFYSPKAAALRDLLEDYLARHGR